MTGTYDLPPTTWAWIFAAALAALLLTLRITDARNRRNQRRQGGGR
jgi:hypothetical protein